MKIKAEVRYEVVVNIITENEEIFDDFDNLEPTEEINNKIKDQAEHILRTSTIKPIIKIIKIKKD